jgi:hypothetical protein
MKTIKIFYLGIVPSVKKIKNINENKDHQTKATFTERNPDKTQLHQQDTKKEPDKKWEYTKAVRGGERHVISEMKRTKRTDMGIKGTRKRHKIGKGKRVSTL